MIEERKRREREESRDNTSDELDDFLWAALGVGELALVEEVKIEDEEVVWSLRRTPISTTSSLLEELAFLYVIPLLITRARDWKVHPFAMIAGSQL